LTKEAVALHGIAREVPAQRLDRHEAIDEHVPREVDARHPTRAEALDEPEAAPDGLADQGIEHRPQRALIVRALFGVVRIELGATRAHLHLSRAYRCRRRPGNALRVGQYPYVVLPSRACVGARILGHARVSPRVAPG